jgi:hypothetical protein
MRRRPGIETAFGRLVEDFGGLRNKGRDFWRGSARFLRKVLAYNLSLRFERTFHGMTSSSYAGNPRFGLCELSDEVRELLFRKIMKSMQGSSFASFMRP